MSAFFFLVYEIITELMALQVHMFSSSFHKSKHCRTGELLGGCAHVADAHVGVSRRSERVELTTAQVQEGAAALRALAGGAHTWSGGGSDGDVLSRVAVVPFHCHDVGAAVQLSRGVLRPTRSCGKVGKV